MTKKQRKYNLLDTVYVLNYSKDSETNQLYIVMEWVVTGYKTFSCLWTYYINWEDIIQDMLVTKEEIGELDIKNLSDYLFTTHKKENIKWIDYPNTTEDLNKMCFRVWTNCDKIEKFNKSWENDSVWRFKVIKDWKKIAEIKESICDIYFMKNNND